MLINNFNFDFLAVFMNYPLDKMRFFIVLLSSILCYTGCTKKNDRTHYTIPDSLKSYCVFNKGSFWKYQLGSTSIYDSTSINLGPEYYTEDNDSHENGVLNDVVKIEFYSTLFREFYIDNTGLTVYQSNEEESAIWTVLLPGHKFINTSSEIFEYLEFLDSLTLNGNSYHKIIHSRYTIHTSVPDSLKYEFFIAKGVGLVIFKKEMNGTDSTWNLITYHVSQ